MKRFIYSLCCIASFWTATPMTSHARSELIVLASPTANDEYYADVMENIVDFHIHFATQISVKDNVLILTDKPLAPRYIKALGKERVLTMPMLDIWMRDFTLSNTIDPVMFRYTAAAQDDQKASDEVQDVFYQLIRQHGLTFKESELLNDGGNFVDDFHGNVVISTKFLVDNALTEAQARRKLLQYDTIRNVAFIEADEQGGLEHADGVVSFIDKNTLLVNRYPQDPDYETQLHAALRRGLPGVTIHTVATPYNAERIHDDRFGSACGLYTNALVTLQRIYLPQFGIPQDSQVLEQVRSLTDKDVIPVNSQQVCFMGGGVRCMSWQLRGHNAELLLKGVRTKLTTQ